MRRTALPARGLRAQVSVELPGLAGSGLVIWAQIGYVHRIEFGPDN